MIRKSAFTLIELLIVVVLLSVLAVVVPHISGAGEETESSAMVADLLRVRSQIELYKFHHSGRLPASEGETPAYFLRRMTIKTDANGNPGGEFGPYLQGLPVNPFNDSAAVRIDGAPAGANTDGWRFDTMTGAFQADDSLDHAMF
jgi:prepilin-type N-terminal cleavage/methylation domain-containing protein